MNSTRNISVILIAKNASAHLTRCLEGLKDFYEVILLVDESTTDDTATLGATFPNVKVFTSPFLGFGPMKRHAESLATQDWIFSIDSDEVVSTELLQEINGLSLQQTEMVYALHRKNHYRGVHINACGWNNDYVIRLYHRKHTSFTASKIHEQVAMQPNSLRLTLKASLLHYPYEGVKGLLDKLNHYSELYAEEYFRRKKSSTFKAIYKAKFTFLKDYLFRKGFIYGNKGFLIALCNANGAFYKYYKLMERNERLRISLIISTHNRPEALEIVLQSALAQTYLPLEILVADDGSREETKLLIDKIRTQSPIPIHHIWHEDKGFRLAEIRNKALAQAQGDFISMLDGDIVMHRNFLKILNRLVRKNTYYQGKRVLLDENSTREYIKVQKVPRLHFFSGGFKNRFNTISSGFLSSLFSKRKKTIKAVKGCSMHFWKADAEKVNGFNEDFVGWGREDSEFVSRLLNSGVKRMNIVFGSVGYHLYHPEASRQMLPANDKILADAVSQRTQRCGNGLDRHISAKKN